MSIFESIKLVDKTPDPKIDVAEHEFINDNPDVLKQLVYDPQAFDFLKKDPNKNHLINNYALPRGLATGQKVTVLSESEKFFDNRYSKQAIGEFKIKDFFTVLSKQSQVDGFKGHRPSKTSHKQRRNSNRPKKFVKSQSCMSLRSMTQHGSRPKPPNINVDDGPVSIDKNGKELFPDFTVTSTENISSIPYLRIIPNLMSVKNYPVDQNIDIEEVKRITKKYKISNTKHKFVEVLLVK
jgi:hypothetical protein